MSLTYRNGADKEQTSRPIPPKNSTKKRVLGHRAFLTLPKAVEEAMSNQQPITIKVKVKTSLHASVDDWCTS